MSESGVVVGVRGGDAFVEMAASKECESCGACRFTKAGRMIATIDNSLNADVGDVVKIDIEPQLVLVASFVVYILPIAFFFIGYGLLAWLGRFVDVASETSGLFGGVSLLVLSYVVIKRIDRRAQISHRFEPKMYAIIQKN